MSVQWTGDRWVATVRLDNGEVAQLGDYPSRAEAEAVYGAAVRSLERLRQVAERRRLRYREPQVSSRWFNAGTQEIREQMLQHAHEEAIREGAQRAGDWFSSPHPRSREEEAAREALRTPGTTDEELDRLIHQYWYYVAGETVGGRGPRDTGVSDDEWNPGRPTEVQPSRETARNAPTGVSLGAGERRTGSVSSTEEGRALTVIGIDHCEQSVHHLTGIQDELDQAIHAFLQAFSTSNQEPARQAVEFASGAKEKIDEVKGIIQEAVDAAGQMIW